MLIGLAATALKTRKTHPLERDKFMMTWLLSPLVTHCNITHISDGHQGLILEPSVAGLCCFGVKCLLKTSTLTTGSKGNKNGPK